MDHPVEPRPPDLYARFAGGCAVLAGVTGFLYTGFFAAYVRGRAWGAKPSAVLLMATGLLGLPVAVGIYERLRRTDAGFALLGLVFAVLGAAGAFLHGGYDVAVLLKPADGAIIAASPADPRGLLTFGASALALFVYARLITAGAVFPPGLARVAAALGALLVVVYLGRLILVDPNKPVLKAAALATGFVLGPVWYVWLGLCLRGRRPKIVAEGGADAG